MNFRRENFLMAISDEFPEYICLALRERVSLIRIYNGTWGVIHLYINSFVHLQHVIHKNIINVKEKVLDNIFYIIRSCFS